MNTERTIARLQEQGAPVTKSEQKVASLGRGIVLLAFGLLLMLLAAGLVLVPIFALKERPTAAFLLFAGLFGIGGLLLVWAGGNVMSGEAMHAAAADGSMLAKIGARVVQTVRGKVAS